MVMLGNILEPGEQIVLRHPSLRVTVAATIVVVGLAATAIMSEFANEKTGWGGSGGAISPDAATGIAMFVAILLIFGRWRVLLTDRRVLVRQGFFGWTIESVRREDIEAAYFINGTLFIDGKERVVSSFCLPYFAAPLLKQIDPLYDNLKLRTHGLRKILLPGERVLLRLRRSGLSILVWTLIPAMPMFALLLLLSFPETLEAINALLHRVSGYAAIAVIVALLGVLQFSFDISWLGVFFDHWRVAVTDRRIIVRRGLLGTRHDEIPRDEIGNNHYDLPAQRLFLHSATSRLAISCSQREAGHIMAAVLSGRTEAN